jgi:hypothetical protein
VNPTNTRPVLAEIDFTASGLATVWRAASEADARRLPLRLLVTRPATIWSNPIAMAPYPPAALAEDDTIGGAVALVREVRAAYPELEVSAAAAQNATTALRHESSRASMLFAKQAIDSGRPQCPVVVVSEA